VVADPLEDEPLEVGVIGEIGSDERHLGMIARRHGRG
jgi:hypothetical protein